VEGVFFYTYFVPINRFTHARRHATKQQRAALQHLYGAFVATVYRQVHEYMTD